MAGESLELTIEAATASLTLSGTTDANGVWQAIAVEDLTELGATFTTFFDEASITIDYLGNAGDATMQPVGATSLEIEGAGLLRAAVTADAYELELDAAGVFNLEIDFSAELPTQNTYLEGLAYTWDADERHRKHHQHGYSRNQRGPNCSLRYGELHRHADLHL